MALTPHRAVLATALATALTTTAAVPALAATGPTSNSTAQAAGLYDGQFFTYTADGFLRFDLTNDHGTWYVQAERDTTSPGGKLTALRLQSTAVDSSLVHVGSNGKTLVLDPVVLPVVQRVDYSAPVAAGTSTFAASFRLNGNEPASNASTTYNPPAGYPSADHYTDTVRPAVATETMFGSTYSQGGQSSDDPLAATLATYQLRGTAS